MKKTLLAGAVVLALSSVAMAQDIEGVKTETIADNTPIANTTLNLKPKLGYRSTEPSGKSLGYLLAEGIFF